MALVFIHLGSTPYHSDIKEPGTDINMAQSSTADNTELVVSPHCSVEIVGISLGSFGND